MSEMRTLVERLLEAARGNETIHPVAMEIYNLVGFQERQIRDLERQAEEARRDIAKEVFALNEDTAERYHAIAERDLEGKQGAFARGRIAEAKSIAKAIGGII